MNEALLALMFAALIVLTVAITLAIDTIGRKDPRS